MASPLPDGIGLALVSAVIAGAALGAVVTPRNPERGAVIGAGVGPGVILVGTATGARQ